MTDSNVDVSILLCTRNRAGDLRETLRSIAAARVPEGLSVELIVVDNNSSDGTATVVKQAIFNTLELRYLFEPVSGLDVARNTGARASRGRAILFTDDDVRIPNNWIELMCRPILSGNLDAVGGGIAIAPHLKRSWMQQNILIWAEINTDPEPRNRAPLIGANCAYSRAVFEKVFGFDAELDAGRLGLCGDTLFGEQVKEAGFRVGSAISECQVSHHFDPTRLLRSSLVARSINQGKSDAYVAHHWLHVEVKWLRGRYFYRWAQRAILSLFQYIHPPPLEGISPKEGQLITRVHFLRSMLNERRRPRQYSYKGLVKLRSNIEY